MADTHKTWEPGSSDDDSIGLTSTAASEHSEDHEFDVERILDERMGDEEEEFLVEWVGYPWQRHLWVTKDCLGQCEEILKEWNERKERFSQGLEDPHDTNAWESKMRKLDQETAERKRRRAKKRRRVAQQGMAGERRKPRETSVSRSSAKKYAKIPPKTDATSKDRKKTASDKKDNSTDSETIAVPLMEQLHEQAPREDTANSVTKSTPEKLDQQIHSKMTSSRTPIKGLNVDTRQPKSALENDIESIDHTQDEMAPPGDNYERPGPVGIRPASLNEPGSNEHKAEKGLEPSIARPPGGIRAKAESKKRKNLPSTNTAGLGKPFKNLAIQNRFQQHRRTEPAPNPDNLVFIDPKTGKNVKGKVHESAATSTTIEPQYQATKTVQTSRADDSIAGGEAQLSEPRIESGVTEPGKVPKVAEHNTTHQSTANAIPSTPEPIITEKHTQPPRLERSTSKQQIQPPPTKSPSTMPVQPPESAPTGPKKSRSMSTTLTSQHQPEEASSPTLAEQSAMASSHRSNPLDNVSDFSLMHTPTKKQSQELWRSGYVHVIAEMRLANLEGGDWDILKVKLLCINEDQQAQRSLLALKSGPRTLYIDFTKSILASEYQKYFPMDASHYLGAGSICAYPEAAAALQKFTEALAIGLRGALFFSHNITMLIYPTGASAWAFLKDGLPSLADGGPLRFLIRQTWPQNLARLDPFVARLVDENPERHREIQQYIRSNPVQQGSKSINVVFRDLFQIEYTRLIAQNEPNKNPAAKVFFLCFIPAGCEDYEKDETKRMTLRNRVSKEHDLFIDFLEANGAEDIYSLQSVDSIEPENDGAWEYFVNNVKCGQIIFHDACIRIDKIPNLARVLRQGTINVWKTSLTPMDPDEKHPHLIRLFPSGCVILITVSLLLYRPKEALRIIMWFARVQHRQKILGTWKIGFRPHILSWLLDVIEVCQDTGRDIFGCEPRVFAQIYAEVYRLLERGVEHGFSLMVYDFDNETPLDEAPVVAPSLFHAFQGKKEWKGDSPTTISPDHPTIQLQDSNLIKWFAQWAVARQLEHFRRFHVILGYPKGSLQGEKLIHNFEKTYGHIEVLSAEQCISRHAVTAQEVLDEMEVKRRRKMRDATAALKIVNEKARKEQVVKKREAFEERLRVYRAMGASEEEVREAGKRHLRRIGREVEDWAGNYMDMGEEGGKGEGDVEMGDADDLAADDAAAAAADADMKEAET